MTIASEYTHQQLDRASELTAEELAQRAKKAALALDEYQQRLMAMTPEELEAAKTAEDSLNHALLAARGLTDWE